MMKYKVGDKVIIKNIEVSTHMPDTVLFNSYMTNYRKSRMTIVDMHTKYLSDKTYYKTYYKMAEDDGEWNWTDDMIEGLAAPLPSSDVEQVFTLDTDTFEDSIECALLSLRTTLLAKNTDYGNSFAKSIEEYGNVVMCIRIGDKLNRLKTLVRGQEQQVSDESITDAQF